MALEKCKQASRELWKEQGSSDGTNGGLEVEAEERIVGISSGESVGVAMDPASLGAFGPGHG